MDNSKKMKDLVAGIGSIAELAHITYTAMIRAGASKEEAMNGMNGFIFAFIHETFEGGRRKKQDEEAAE